jgi:2-polyprenyl-6-methoxyphenol hydroxylase-like FAD-dependent oxidoreductase
VRAIVVGGGIGGLTTAVALQRTGLEVVVLERARELRAAGAGIALWANATRVLRRLGLHGAVLEAGAEIGGQARAWRGRKLFSFSAGDLRRKFGEANLAIHRADLQAALLDALPAGTVRLGAELTGFEQRASGVTAHLAGGEEESGGLLVGADGLYSTVRARVLGDGPPRYAGFTAWRGIVEDARALLPEGAGLNLWGRGAEFGLAGVGRGRAYWYATKNAPEGEPEEVAGRKEEVLERLALAYRPARAAVEATREADILRTDLYDREPARRWGVGRATLLGDAAHPMTPSLGQGACQAIEDAAALADALKENPGDPAAALRNYEERRAGRAADIVRRSRRMAAVMQSESPLLCPLRDGLARAMPANLRLRLLDPVAGYEV